MIGRRWRCAQCTVIITPRAVCDEDDGTLDRRERAIELRDPRGARELVALHARHGARVGELRLEQRLPVLRHVIAQAGHESVTVGAGARSLRPRAPGELRANHLLVELAHAGLRDRVDEVDAVGHRVLRDRRRARRSPATWPRIAVLGRRAAPPALHDDERDRTLAPLVVGHADDRHLGDARARAGSGPRCRARTPTRRRSSRRP